MHYAELLQQGPAQQQEATLQFVHIVSATSRSGFDDHSVKSLHAFRTTSAAYGAAVATRAAATEATSVMLSRPATVSDVLQFARHTLYGL